MAFRQHRELAIHGPSEGTFQQQGLPPSVFPEASCHLVEPEACDMCPTIARVACLILTGLQ